MESSELLHYLAGDEIHAGDRVQYGGVFATVVAVSDGNDGEYSPGYEDWTGMSRGIVICDDDGAVTTLPEGDEKLEFVSRS
jgi:predicted RecA/RadA family phage recombinase